MSDYVAIKNGRVVNILNAPTKEIAEEASGLECVDYDLEFHPVIGDSYIDGIFQKNIVDEVVVE